MSEKRNIKFAVVGAGAMATAIVKGLLSQNLYQASEIIFLSRTQEKLEKQREELEVSITTSYEDFKKQINDDAFLLLAVKPQVLESALKGLKGIKATNKLISVAAGKTISNIENYFPDNEIYRVMPNTPSQIMKGASAFCTNTKAKNKEKILEIFSAIGACVEVEERDLDAVTALSGSGPAYIFLMAEAMTNAAIKLGLKNEVAKKLAYQTIYGSACLLEESQEKAEDLRAKVTSPNGTTQAGIESFQANGFENIVFEALNAAKKRSIELN